jgi:membrane-associated phospholipid phosphatase
MTVIDRLLDADRAACGRLRALPHAELTDRLLAGASRATDDAIGWILLGLGAAVADRDRRCAWLIAAATVVAADRASVVIKHAVRRPRPQIEGLAPLATAPSPLSFPSSHTASAVAMATMAREMPGGPRLRWAAAMIAASRPYLGMHYPSDVLAGAAVGVVVGSLGRRAAQRWER